MIQCDVHGQWEIVGVVQKKADTVSHATLNREKLIKSIKKYPSPISQVIDLTNGDELDKLMKTVPGFSEVASSHTVINDANSNTRNENNVDITPELGINKTTDNFSSNETTTNNIVTTTVVNSSSNDVVTTTSGTSSVYVVSKTLQEDIKKKTNVQTPMVDATPNKIEEKANSPTKSIPSSGTTVLKTSKPLPTLLPLSPRDTLKNNINEDSSNRKDLTVINVGQNLNNSVSINNKNDGNSNVNISNKQVFRLQNLPSNITINNVTTIPNTSMNVGYKTYEINPKDASGRYSDSTSRFTTLAISPSKELLPLPVQPNSLNSSQTSMTKTSSSSFIMSGIAMDASNPNTLPVNSVPIPSIQIPPGCISSPVPTSPTPVSIPTSILH